MTTSGAAVAQVDACVLPPRRASLDRTSIGGLPLTERAVLSLHRAGIQRIAVSTERIDADQLALRLARKGISITLTSGGAAESIRPGHAAILVSADVVFETAALDALVARGVDCPEGAVCATEALAGIFAYLPPASVECARAFASMGAALWPMYRGHRLTRVDIAPAFCRPVPSDGRVWHLEGEDIRHRQSRGDVVTRALSVFSIPTSQVFLRLGTPPPVVTALGLIVALLAVVHVAAGGEWPGLIGALLGFASVVLACSARDMERASLSRWPGSVASAPKEA